MAAGFDIAACGRGEPCFDIARLQALNRRLLGDSDFAAVSERLPQGATEAFWLAVRGNLDTRLRKLEAGECDALVLACAGLDRLGRTQSVHQLPS